MTNKQFSLAAWHTHMCNTGANKSISEYKKGKN